MDDLAHKPSGVFHHVGRNQWVRIEDVQAWDWDQQTRKLYIHLRHRQAAIIYECDSVQVKAFELALQK